MQLSLVVPLYKGATFVTEDIQAKYNALREFLPENEFELIYIIDGHIDDSYELAQAFIAEQKLQNVSVYLRSNNKGKGYSVVEGMYYARGKFIAYTDAGFDIELSALAEMYQKIMSDKQLTAVLANKYHRDSVYKTSPLRRILSRGYITIVNILFQMSLADLQTGMKMFRRSAIIKVLPKLTIKKFAFEIELLTALKINGFKKIADVPVKLCMVTSSTMHLGQDSYNMFKDTVAVFYRAYILKWYGEHRLVAPNMFKLQTIISEVNHR